MWYMDELTYLCGEDLLINDLIVLPMPYGISQVVRWPKLVPRGKVNRQWLYVRVMLDTCTIEATRNYQFKVMERK